MTGIQASHYPRGSVSPKGHVKSLPDTNILLVCNGDYQLAESIAFELQCIGARKVFRTQYVEATLEAQTNLEQAVKGKSVVISLLYNNYEKQEMLVNICIQERVDLFISWDAGMELDVYVSDKRCPRTRLHQYLRSINSMNWILFQVGIFGEEVLKHDISAITTAFNSPRQYIFINITIKEDLAQLIAESLRSNKIEYNRNYVVGDFVAHTFLGHVYQVANNGVALNIHMPADISEFQINNQLRLSGIVSARPLPHILYPGCSFYFHKLGIEISFQHDAAIYKILPHRRVSLKEWVYNKIQ